MEALRTAIIGAGAISLEHLRFLAAMDESRLVGVCDLSAVAAKTLADKFEIEGSFVDAAEMMSTCQPDVVHVLTPPSSHGALVRSAIDAGCHVICEKPLGRDAGEVQQLLRYAEGADRQLFENHNYRFNDVTLALSDLASTSEIGPIREVDIRIALPIRAAGSRMTDEGNPDPIHQMPAGAVHDVITHLAYLTDQLSHQAKWDVVKAIWNNHGGGELFAVDDLDAILSGHRTDGPVNARVRFAANTRPDGFSITIRGENGEASGDLFHPFISVRRSRRVGQQLSPIADHLLNGYGLARSGLSNFKQKLVQHTPYHGLGRFLDLTYSALLAGSSPPVTPRDIAATADLVDRLVAERRAE